jgi:hypothetical protein
MPHFTRIALEHRRLEMSAKTVATSFDPDLDVCAVTDGSSPTMSLLVIVFCLELTLYFISTIGAKPINEAVRSSHTPPLDGHELT